MGLIRRLRDSTRRQKAQVVKQEIANHLRVNPLASDYENVFAQVQPLVNEMILVRPFGVGRNGGELPSTRTPELALLEAPNDAMGWVDFAGSMFRTWLTEDELNVRVHFDKNKVIGYTIIHPGSKVYDGSGSYHFQVNSGGEIETVSRDEVMTLVFSRSPKNLQQGISPATAVRAWAQAEDVLAQYERAYIENGAIPASITFIRASSYEKFDQVRREMEGELRGAANHGKTVYVWRQFNNDTGESLDQVEVKTIQGNNSTLAIKELTDIINDHLNKAFGVSNFILGDDSSAKYDNAELSDYQFTRRRVFPALTAFWNQFQTELDRVTGGLGYSIQFELELPDLTERKKTQAEIAELQVKNLTSLVQAGSAPAAAVEALGLDESWGAVAKGVYQKTLAGRTDKINNRQNVHIPPDNSTTARKSSQLNAPTAPASVAKDDLPNMDADERKIYDVLVAMAERIFADEPNIDADGVIAAVVDVLEGKAELGARDGADKLIEMLDDADVVAGIKSGLENLDLSGTLRDRVSERATELVKGYGESTRNIMNEVLASNKGKSAGEIRKALREVMPTWQAERIARTETVYAYKSGRLDEDQRIADKYGLKMKLVWRCRHDGKTCDVCAAMDGETVSVGEAFEHVKETADGTAVWEPSKWNDDGKIPAPHPNCRCYFDEIVEEA